MLLIFFLFLFLFPLTLIHSDDLQEALLNRNNRAAGSFSPSPYSFLVVDDGSPLCNLIAQNTGYSFNCAIGCLVDSDCTWRLGSQQSLVKYPFGSPAPVTNNTSTNELIGALGRPVLDVHIAELEVMCNILASIGYDSPATDKLCTQPILTNPPCDGFLTDECCQYNIEDLATNNLFQTAVDYPNMRCLSGRCVHFLDDFPGYGEEYCLPLNNTVTRLANTCALPQMTCNRYTVPAKTPIPFTPVQSFFDSSPMCFDPLSKPSTLTISLRDRTAPTVVQPNQQGNPPQIYYSQDPQDIIGVCSCTSDQTCGVTGMKCLPDSDAILSPFETDTLANGGSLLGFTTSLTNNRCYCTASSQCIFHGGGSQQCITNALVIGNNPEIIGTCGCVVGSMDSCSNNGICTSLQRSFPQNTFQAYYTVESYALGAAKVPIQPGRCECLGQVQAGNTWVETVTGAACEDDTYIDLKCSGLGIPICIQGAGDEPVYSLNGGGEIGVSCFTANFTSRGTYACQCFKGFTPDVLGQGSFGSTPMCSVGIQCGSANLPSAVEINGLCECTQDYFQLFSIANLQAEAVINNYGACIPDCSLIKSGGKGICFYNPNFVAPQLQPNNGISYNNDVQCIITGWTTFYGYDTSTKAYFDICFGCTHTAPSISPVIVQRLEGPITSIPPFCSVPVNPYLGATNICGDVNGGNSLLATIGFWAAGQCVCMPLQCIKNRNTGLYESPLSDFPSCPLVIFNGIPTFLVVDNGNNPIIYYQPQYPIPYCARTCQFLTANMTDPNTPSAFDNVVPQLCGGPKRGTCQPDALGGSYCLCKPGYQGIACQRRLCPAANGFICSGNGLCDASTGFCVCDFGFVGTSCQFRANNCAGSQCVRSYPLPNYNLPDY